MTGRTNHAEQMKRFPLRMNNKTSEQLEEMSTFLNESMNKLVCQAIDEKYDRFLARKDDLLALRDRKFKLEAELNEINHQINN